MTKKTFRNLSINQLHNQALFYIAPKRLPHVAISKTERNRTKNINPMSSFYNTPCIKQTCSELLLEHWNKSCDVHPCDIVPRCPVSRCQVSRFQSPPMNCETSDTGQTQPKTQKSTDEPVR